MNHTIWGQTKKILVENIRNNVLRRNMRKLQSLNEVSSQQKNVLIEYQVSTIKSRLFN